MAESEENLEKHLSVLELNTIFRNARNSDSFGELKQIRGVNWNHADNFLTKYPAYQSRLHILCVSLSDVLNQMKINLERDSKRICFILMSPKIIENDFIDCRSIVNGWASSTLSFENSGDIYILLTSSWPLEIYNFAFPVE